MSTEKAKKPLATLGSEVFNAFLGLRQTLSNISSKPEATQALHGLPDRDLLEHKIANEHQRFSLFAASLGLRQHGHASLDYRLRDAGVMREHAAGILEEVIDHIESGKR